ncbi:hypothetical protein [Flexivirga sp.]|uniref:hypothetical protein n=1 Tax=Flexivirga sp. TaxID=1962927 RepID=UPI003F81A197
MTKERSRSFGRAAAAYEKHRPEYPDEIVHLVREYAARPIRSALELGAGTGKPVDTSTDGMHWPATELVGDARFVDLRETVLEQRLTFARADWIGYLSTVSAYLVLSEEDRAAAFAAIGDVLPDAVDVHADVTLHLARRV